MNVDGAGTSSARRRRERRLRSWWRHERMSVAAALAEAHHHSSPKVGAETHDALRRQKTASAGARPGVLQDPAPQGAVTVGYVAAPVPLLFTPSLADTMADQVDDRAVDILQFALKKKEEVEERRRQEEVAEHERRMRVLDRRIAADEQLTPEESYAWRAWAGHLPGGKRKRKKRRKRRTPRTSSLPCRARRRHRQWLVPVPLFDMWSM